MNDLEKQIQSPTQLAEEQKLEALALRYYDQVEWKPRAGDYYTTPRTDLELYQVVKIEDGKVYTRYCHYESELTEWDEEGFVTEGFGSMRVWVPDWTLGILPEGVSTAEAIAERYKTE